MRYLAALFLFLSTAQAQTFCVRNDNLATTLQAEDGKVSACALTSKGAEHVEIAGKTISVSTLGTVAFGSLSTTYANCVLNSAYTGRIRGVILRNGTDKELVFSIDNGSSDFITLASGDGIAVSFVQMGGMLANNTVKVKETAGNDTTSGNAYCTVIGES